ncbi:hypothetical protein HOLleu_21641 [Holothuria leucospilota]|uniref:Ig-like domain-containing protein n=1 Tax=Holothuria leucospilota TaxID=206669 RepID=A0A9Q1H6L8_HOLLE|nr:hypothetical protein HOLleu_21641 [Holothuria leucospilota]
MMYVRFEFTNEQFGNQSLQNVSPTGLGKEAICDESSEVQNDYVFKCNGVIFHPVCLICDANRTETDVRWYVEGRQLTHDEFNLDATQAGGIWINHGCRSERYSLRLRRPSMENHNEIFYCMKKGRVVSRFKLKLRALTNLYINKTSLIIFNNELLVFKEDTVKVLQCVVEGAIPPFRLFWSLNGVTQKIESFNSTADRFATHLLIKLQTLANQDLLTCSSEGKYIDSDNVSLTLNLLLTENGCRRRGSSKSATTRREVLQIELNKVCSQRSIRASHVYVEDSIEERNTPNEMQKTSDMTSGRPRQKQNASFLSRDTKAEAGVVYFDINEYERHVFPTKET